MGGSKSKSSSTQETNNIAFDQRVAATDKAIAASGNAVINATQLDGGAIAEAGKISRLALETGAATVTNAAVLASKALSANGEALRVGAGVASKALKANSKAIDAVRRTADSAIGAGVTTAAQATDLASQALNIVDGGFQSFTSTLSDVLDQAIGAAVTTQANAQSFAAEARLDGQSTQLVKIMPWLVGAAAVAFIMARA